MDEITNKRTVAEIGDYFDGEVERFSDLSRGQASIRDARLMMDLLAETAAALAPEACEILDIGCGAGNQTLNLLRIFPDADCTLLDISPAMLARARERVSAAARGKSGIPQNHVFMRHHHDSKWNEIKEAWLILAG